MVGREPTLRDQKGKEKNMTDMNNVLLAGNNAFCVGDRAFEWGVDVGSIESIRCDGISWFAVIKLDAPDRYGRRRFPLTVGDLCHPQFRPMDKLGVVRVRFAGLQGHDRQDRRC